MTTAAIAMPIMSAKTPTAMPAIAPLAKPADAGSAEDEDCGEELLELPAFGVVVETRPVPVEAVVLATADEPV